MTASELIMTITADYGADTDRQIAEAERIAITYAMADRTKGIVVTRYSSNLFTIALSSEVPYGLTRERLFEDSTSFPSQA